MNTNRTLVASQRWQIAFFGVLLVLIFTALFHTIYDIEFSGTGLYMDYASQIITKGSVAYLDFPLEYPPLSLLFFLLPRLATSTYIIYAVLYQVEVVIFVLIGLYLVYDISRRLGQAPWKMMTVYTIAVLAMGPITGQQYDIFPAVMSLAAVYFFWLGKNKTSWALLALGAMTKIFPAAIAPIFLIYYLRNHQYRQISSGIITFAAVCLVILLPFLIISPGSLLSLYDYHAQRGIQLESTYSSFLLLADKLGLVSVQTAFDFGSWNVVGSIENIFASLSTPLLVLFLLVTYLVFYIQSKPGKSYIQHLGAYALLVTLIVLITSKILSPQYLIWIIPIIPLVSGPWRYTIWFLFAVIGGLTYYIFPLNYTQLIDKESLAIVVLLLRNILLIFMAVLVGLTVKQNSLEKSSEAEKPEGV